MKHRCRSLRRDLLLLVDHSLDERRVFALEQHLQACGACRDELREHQALEQRLLSTSELAFSDEDEARLLQEIRQRIDPKRLPRRLALRRFGRAAAAVILAGIACGVGFRVLQRDPVLELVEERSIPEIAPSTQVAAPIADATGFDLPDELPLAVASPLELEALRQARLLTERLEDQDPQLAESAAMALSELGSSPELARSLPVLTTTLRRALQREDRGAVMLALASRIQTSSARQLLLDACEIPFLRERALLEILNRAEPEFVAAREQKLLRLLRSNSPSDQQILARVLEHLEMRRTQDLKLVSALYREGAPREWIAAAIARAPAESIEWIQRSLVAFSPNARGILSLHEALSLAETFPRSEWRDSLQQLARRKLETARAIDALSLLPEAIGSIALAELWLEPVFSATERRMLRAGFHEALLHLSSPQVPVQAILAREDQPALAQSLLELCSQVPGAAGTEVLLAMLEEPKLPSPLRSLASLHLACREVPPPPQELLHVLERERSQFETQNQWQGQVVSSVLVALYEIEGERGIREGCIALGIVVDKQSASRLLKVAENAAGQARAGNPGSTSGSLERIRELLMLVP